MKKIINISDNYRVEVDDFNHTLYSWQEPELITQGKYKDTMSKGGWKQEGYYPNLQQALRSAAQIEMLADNKETYTLQEWAQKFESIWNKMRTQVVEVVPSDTKETTHA